MAFQKLKLALVGYGKMGKAIEQIAIAKGHEVILKITSANLADLNAKNLSQCDVAIEFTRPESAVTNIKACLDAGIPVVCGTTGWLNNLRDIEAIVTNDTGSFLYASNFSIGVNIFFELNKKLASLMASHDEYDTSIEEIHHTAKKDSPSGTAITLANDILAIVTRKKAWKNIPTGNQEDLTITSKRIDPAPGTHIIRYASPVDEIEITHIAKSREGFASGAVMAAEFLQNKKGIFTMKDVLGIS